MSEEGLRRIEAETETHLAPGADALTRARAMRRLAALVGDAHLAVGLPEPTLDEHTFVPFLVKRVGARYVVDAGSSDLEIGAEVVSVEDEPIEPLMARLAELSVVDGGRSSVRLAEAERRFAEHARLELGALARWRVVTRTADGAVVEHMLAGVDRASLGRMESERRSAPVWGSRGTALPTLDVHGDVTVLRLSTFGTTDRAAYLEAIERLAPAFTAASQLVVDLRGNEGGDRSLGVAVARHLLATPFAQWQRVRTRVRDIPDRFRDRVSFPFAPREALTGFPGEAVGEEWVFEGEPLEEEMHPIGAGFEGDLRLFVDDATSSAAIELAVALLAHHPRVRVVGSETQGECGRHVGQLPVVFDDGLAPALLVSLFEIELVHYDGCRDGRGIEPDVSIVYSDEDFRDARDPYLDAMSLVRGD